jgi:hypothetical protein
MTGGICLAMIHGQINHPDPTSVNLTELTIRYQFHEQFTIPHMKEIFPLLTIFNIGVAFIILMFPLYWIWIVRFSQGILTPEQVPMKCTVYFLILAVGHNTFYKSYVAFKTIPFPIFATMYYPHAFLEILAYIFTGAFSLLCIDAIRNYLQNNDCLHTMHPGDLSLFIFRRVWSGFVITGVMLFLGAFIECYVTPEMVFNSMKEYFKCTYLDLPYIRLCQVR